jgi:hypothetical protein
MIPAELDIYTLNWRKARRSATNGECIEVASIPGQIIVRDSKKPDGSVLCYDVIDWRKFIDRAKKNGMPCGYGEPSY